MLFDYGCIGGKNAPRCKVLSCLVVDVQFVCCVGVL